MSKKDAPDVADAALLGAAQVRELAERLEVRPTKQWGQNFVVDANTVRKIVRVAGVGPHDVVVEVGPGLGSLTLALLPVVKHVTAVEVDPRLAGALEQTVQSLLQRFPTIERVLVMVQLEVAERLAAKPGSKIYGVPSLKAAWYADVELAGRVGRNVFWPAPNVDSGLVSFRRRKPPKTTASREDVFRCIDAAFLQRRKALRGALASWAGSPDAAERALVAAGVDPRTRGEQLDITTFARIAEARPEAHPQDADAGRPRPRRRGHTS